MNSMVISSLALLAVAAVLCLLWILRFRDKQRRDDPTVWERSIRRFEKSDRISFPAPGSILFVGSSSIRFWKSLSSDMAHLSVLNRGFGGSQIHELTYYVPQIAPPYQPRAIVF